MLIAFTAWSGVLRLVRKLEQRVEKSLFQSSSAGGAFFRSTEENKALIRHGMG